MTTLSYNSTSSGEVWLDAHGGGATPLTISKTFTKVANQNTVVFKCGYAVSVNDRVFDISVFC